MIIEFEDSCWTNDSPYWIQTLVELLAMLARRHQHALLAKPVEMLSWCQTNLPSHSGYFTTRLASAQIRQNATTLRVSPTGNQQVNADPVWILTADAAANVIDKPLRVVLENNQSDKHFLQSTIPDFKQWCDREWIVADMGGGSAMGADILTTSASYVKKWKTFYLFDSDRLHPNELNSAWSPPGGDGCQGFVFQQRCVSMPPRRWHMLERRSIENYLPQSILGQSDFTKTNVLFDPSVGEMLKYYNFKEGLKGDGVDPVNPRQVIRAARSNGFWTSLPATVVDSLRGGFGTKIADDFTKVPDNYTWPTDIYHEMDILSAAIQDAM